MFKSNHMLFWALNQLDEKRQVSKNKHEESSKSANVVLDKDGHDEKNVFPDNKSTRETPHDDTDNEKLQAENAGVMTKVNGPIDRKDR